SDPAHKAEWGNSPTVVFKRPKGSHRNVTGADMFTPSPTTPITPHAGASSGPSPKSTTSNRGGGNDPFAAAPSGAAPINPELDYTLIRLVHANAESLAKTLDELFSSRKCRVVADRRTNSLLISADEPTLKSVKTVVKELDVPSADRRTP